METIKRIKIESGIWIIIVCLLICFNVFWIFETPFLSFKIIFGFLTGILIYVNIRWMKLLIKCRDFEIRKDIQNHFTKKIENIIEKEKDIKPKKRK